MWRSNRWQCAQCAEQGSRYVGRPMKYKTIQSERREPSVWEYVGRAYPVRALLTVPAPAGLDGEACYEAPVSGGDRSDSCCVLRL